ncbi:hypothetical protein CYLTODRAFT_439053, partial [Cylindrobasidium torrendii FP15055 ss-10]
MQTSTVTVPPSVLGKRKTRSGLILRLETSSEQSDSDYTPQASTSKQVLEEIEELADRPSKSKQRPRKYKCSHDGCDKAYTKPVKLAEHELTHTGDRPHTCDNCGKSYTRHDHLLVHKRAHLPVSERPLACDRPHCEKRFWTNQHLKRHLEWHTGFEIKCAWEGCNETFPKNHQLRAHIAEVHFPEDTKPYICAHDGCIKSYNTQQLLDNHARSHRKQYICSHAQCLAGDFSSIFTTWSALQHHMKVDHPPTCPYPECNGRTFKQPKNLRGHLKIHEQREIEAELNGKEEESDEERPRKRRRGGEVGRDFSCDVSECTKAFKSKRALSGHHKVVHLKIRDFTCPYDDCDQKFAYKHVMQRHIARDHEQPKEDDADDESETNNRPKPRRTKKKKAVKIELDPFDVDVMTGNHYKQHATKLLQMPAENADENQTEKVPVYLPCPFPALEIPFTVGGNEDVKLRGHACDYVFSRAYDIKRHLQRAHGVETEKADVKRWVKQERREKEQWAAEGLLMLST